MNTITRLRLAAAGLALGQPRQLSARSRAAVGALGEALSAGDRAEQSFELARIRIYQQKVATLMADADACAGDDGGVLGQNRTDVEIDPTIPKGDPTDPGLPSPTSAMAPPGIEEAATDSPSSNPLMP